MSLLSDHRGMGPSPRRVAELFLAAGKSKLPNLEALLDHFGDRFVERDAIKVTRGDSQRITGQMIAEVAWEIGYEGDPYTSTLGEFEPLAKKMGVDLRSEYNQGAAAR